MKTIAIVTSLILGLSTAAFAAPSGRSESPKSQAPVATERDHRDVKLPVGVDDHDHRIVKGDDAWKREPSWIALASATTLSRGKDVISVGARQKVSTLKLTAVRGSVAIDKITITFAGGAKQTLEVDQMLATDAPAMIQLPGQAKRITKIVVTGKAGRKASFAVMAA
jgi:hypothetical protein